MDALIPFVDNLGKGVDEAAKAARKGAESTRSLEAQMGRASYLASEDVKKAALPDAGAWGLAALLDGLSRGLKQ